MSARWRAISVIVLLAAMVLTLVHWHLDLDGQRCELCRVQQLPTLYTPLQNPLPSPAVQEWHAPVFKAGVHDAEPVAVPFGRAPPACSFV
jgi:hypothetical protein